MDAIKAVKQLKKMKSDAVSNMDLKYLDYSLNLISREDATQGVNEIASNTMNIMFKVVEKIKEGGSDELTIVFVSQLYIDLIRAICNHGIKLFDGK